MSQDIKKIGIIGGGAAGLFAACLFKKFSGDGICDVTLLEKNEVPGKKLILTGHGRCNITNRKPASELKTGYHEADNFIYPAIKEFGPEDTISFIENDIGLKTKEEDNNRIFPVCDSAARVRDSLVSYIAGSTKTVCNSKVLDIRKDSSFEVSTADEKYNFDYMILCCGGSSFPQTGSAGDSYRLAGKTGHTVITPRAALAPVKADEESLSFIKNLSGVSVASRVSLFCNGKKTASTEGEVLFAEFGLTGPAVMEISREIPRDISDCDPYFELDLVPALTEEQFDLEFQKLIGDHPDTKITTLLARYVPASVAGEIATKAGVSDLYAQGFTKDNRRKTINEMKHLKVLICREPSIDKAYVTRGGVSLKEVDRKTMQSRIVPGLYILGEALDIDGISGGYNLQACMSEAYLAVKDILGL
ncbi:MAG: aminoacetone oxidase family FAD-binding enzyme [Eubacteriales bacterium]|nr:aminoacetone oxidase family FAD-binding enzyme [Eubacteriales bacterium]